MRTSLPPLLAVAATLVFAGCLGPAQDATPGPSPSDQGQGLYDDAPNDHAAAPGNVAQDGGGSKLEAWFLMFPFNGHLTVAAGAKGVGYTSPTGAQDPHLFHFPVEEGATALVLELRWDDPAQDLDLEFGSPSCDSNVGSGVCVFVDDGSFGNGDSPVRVVYTDASGLSETGDWILAAWAKNAVDVDFEIAATVFYGMDAPEGFSIYEL